MAPATNSEPATSQETSDGLAANWLAGSVTYSAWLDRRNGEPDHLIAHSEIADAGAEFGHHTRQIAALTGGKRRRELVGQGAAANHRLTRIDASCPDLDQNLTGFRNGAGHVTHLEDLHAPVRIELHCFRHERNNNRFT